MNEPTIWARAKAVLEQRGWHQGDFGSNPSDLENCRVCIAGAVNVACGRIPWDDEWPASRDVFERLNGEVPQAFISMWNDEPARTVDDVYELLDRLDREDRR